MQTDVHFVPVDYDFKGHNLLKSLTLGLALVL